MVIWTKYSLYVRQINTFQIADRRISNQPYWNRSKCKNLKWVNTSRHSNSKPKRFKGLGYCRDSHSRQCHPHHKQKSAAAAAAAAVFLYQDQKRKELSNMEMVFFGLIPQWGLVVYERKKRVANEARGINGCSILNCNNGFSSRSEPSRRHLARRQSVGKSKTDCWNVGDGRKRQRNIQ